MFYEYPTRFIAGLCAYVRQASLSVDRAFSDSFQADLRSYYSQKSTPSVDAVLSGLGRFGRRCAIPIKAVFSSDQCYLTRSEANRIKNALMKLRALLETSGEVSQADRMSLRLELSHIEAALSEKVPKSSVDSIRCVEHYNQADMLKLKPLEEIAGNGWPIEV